MHGDENLKKHAPETAQEREREDWRDVMQQNVQTNA
jgi:hypothetical protein